MINLNLVALRYGSRFKKLYGACKRKYALMARDSGVNRLSVVT